jgi:uncharacterized protein (DUF58 family)
MSTLTIPAAPAGTGGRVAEPAQLLPPPRRGRATARGRVPIAFGPRFFLLLLLGLIWLGPAWWQPRFALAMLVWDLLVLLAWVWDLSRLPAAGEIEVLREWSTTPGLSMEGRVRVVVGNPAAHALVVFAVDEVPLDLRRAPPELEFTIRPREEAENGYDIRPARRGDCSVGRMHLRYQSLLGIAERWAVVDLRQTIRIYPNLDEAKKHTIFLIRSRQIELEKRRKRMRGRGREFESLREYRDGDEWRDVFWPATARRGKLITRVFQIERSQPVWMVLDAGRLLRARDSGLSKLDYAVNAALSLAQVALYSGDRVGLLAYGRGIQQRLAPGRGAAHLREMVERLALVSAEGVEADHLGAVHTLSLIQRSRGLVVWLTDLAETAATPDVIEGALHLARKHLVLFAVIGNPELSRLARIHPHDPEQMYAHVAAIEMVHRRELLLRQLRERGTLTAEAEPGKLSVAVVNHYLDIKERNLL